MVSYQKKSALVFFEELSKTGEASNSLYTFTGGPIFMSILKLLGYKKKEHE
ncbi:LPXTG cell wall anchor domain-containing protein [Enterococcus sp. 5B3_DIV0040]|uniref:LPXTG cell wall anchor domain-containing protein n=1 Tax=Enterococcus sp. 5B3_DIV0040 TaxID=1834182 RepID=UPI0011306A0B